MSKKGQETKSSDSAMCLFKTGLKSRSDHVGLIPLLEKGETLVDSVSPQRSKDC